jgi:hypothetical protein
MWGKDGVLVFIALFIIVTVWSLSQTYGFIISLFE